MSFNAFYVYLIMPSYSSRALTEVAVAVAQTPSWNYARAFSAAEEIELRSEKATNAAKASYASLSLTRGDHCWDITFRG